jgi:hypothetical protein
VVKQEAQKNPEVTHRKKIRSHFALKNLLILQQYHFCFKIEQHNAYLLNKKSLDILILNMMN